ncbi:YigZ family protein [Enterococcus asini]|uniref:YigZ family protein n=1 Tax=Enterococcus asini TaxID=57732 RepID=UPI000E4EBF67|nr:YigZ family protein [Enterococcus asini]MCD5028292.1 YigZ family protein [Enterococcus asini]MDT2762837.1 YigZ family protein [Enterococcus asini]RGW13362.1 YigZ family protein [Enterococcus asini]
MQATYKTIKTDGLAETEIKKSRFLCHLKRVTSEEEAKAFIQGIKKEHWKANHNCSAYLIGEHSEIQRSSDDGEPSGTAGVPMLEVLKKNDLINVCVVVTRYFGGIKLGAGGLIRAYSHAVSHGLQTVGLVMGKLQQEISLDLDYSLLGKLQNSLPETTIKETIFAEKVTVICRVDEEQVENFEAEIIDLLQGQVTITRGATGYEEIPIE